MKSSILFMALLILVSCSSTNEWEVLFDGKTVQGLRGYRQTDFPSKDWVVVDGTLKTIPGHGVDLISENIYKDDKKSKTFVYNILELFLIKDVSVSNLDIYNYFLKRIDDFKKFNLDDESLFLEINSKLLNG